MTDCFALFGERRRPWLEPDALKEKFLRLSHETHPDHVHAENAETKAAGERRYAELVAAHNTLREPRERLGHWLELTRGAKPVPLQNVPPALQNLIFGTGQLLRATEKLREEKSRLSSPLLKVQFFERCQPSLAQLNAALQKIGELQSALHAELKAIDAAMVLADNEVSIDWLRLEEIYHALGFLGRSAAQLRERTFELTA